MRDAGIDDGDRLIVDRSVRPRHGDIVVAVVSGELTVKRFYQRGGVVKLLAANPTFPDIRPRDGKVLEMGRSDVLHQGVVVKTSRPVALIDGNSFYCSCERVCRPALVGKQLIFVSNNDGCSIARTAAANALGIKMGQPWFEIRHLERDAGLVALSTNFELYSDVSDRTMAIIGQSGPTSIFTASTSRFCSSTAS